MAELGKCPKHDAEYEEEEAQCSQCQGDGICESTRDDCFGDEMVTCWKCGGAGEYTYPVCYQCDDEYEESDYGN